MRRGAIFLAIGAALLAAPVGIWTTAETIRQLRDPCVRWGATEQAFASLPTDSACSALQINAETRRQAAVRVALVSGSILAASLLGLRGALLVRPAMTVSGAAMFSLIAPISMSVGALFVAARGLLLFSARALRRRETAAP